MMIRRYLKGEESELWDIFFSSIRENAKDYYSEEQLSAWAPEEYDSEKWCIRIKNINPYVIVENNLILGYADLQEDGYIDSNVNIFLYIFANISMYNFILFFDF
jgi:putative acetyltransferase